MESRYLLVPWVLLGMCDWNLDIYIFVSFSDLI